MSPLHTTELSTRQKVEVFKLWNNEYPVGLMFNNIQAMDKFIAGLQDLKYIMLLDRQGSIVAWMGIFTRDGERWFSILVNSNFQGKGYGKLLLDDAKKQENSLNGWVLDHNKEKKVDGDTYYSPLSFYLKNGFDVLPDERYEENNVSALKINWEKEVSHA